MIRDTGSPRADAESDFLRARRGQKLSALAAWFRSERGNAVTTMSFDETVQALGRRGEHSLGVLVIPLDRIVGSVDKVRDFDRSFRPTSGRGRTRWERLAQAVRRGEPIPPISVYKLGDLYFVQDGHHRVSVNRALGMDLIEARVTEVQTLVSTEGVTGSRDLDNKRWRRIFLERVPLTGKRRDGVRISDPRAYGELAEMVEAWATRRMHAEEAYVGKRAMATRWYDEEYQPVLAMIEEAGLRTERETPAESYLRIADERYDIVQEHAWDQEVMRLLAAQKKRKRS